MAAGAGDFGDETLGFRRVHQGFQQAGGGAGFRDAADGPAESGGQARWRRFGGGGGVLADRAGCRGFAGREGFQGAFLPGDVEGLEAALGAAEAVPEQGPEFGGQRRQGGGFGDGGVGCGTELGGVQRARETDPVGAEGGAQGGDDPGQVFRESDHAGKFTSFGVQRQEEMCKKSFASVAVGNEGCSTHAGPAAAFLTFNLLTGTPSVAPSLVVYLDTQDYSRFGDVLRGKSD